MIVITSHDRGRPDGGHTLILRSAVLFSLHQAKASVQLWCERASSMRRISINKSMSTKGYPGVRVSLRSL